MAAINLHFIPNAMTLERRMPEHIESWKNMPKTPCITGVDISPIIAT